MKIRGVNLASRWGRIANQRKRWKIIRDFPSDLTCNFEMEITMLSWSFLFLKSFFKSIERIFLHESNTFKAPFKKEGGELTFSRLGCQHLKISLRWMHPQRLNLKIAFSLRRCRNSKKSLRWMHPQRLNFWTMPGTAVGATFWSSKVGPEWSLFFMALTFFMKKYENRNATADQQAGSPPRVRILQRR